MKNLNELCLLDVTDVDLLVDDSKNKFFLVLENLHVSHDLREEVVLSFVIELQSPGVELLHDLRDATVLLELSIRVKKHEIRSLDRRLELEVLLNRVVVLQL